MSERGLPIDGAHACPFVAFEDDRDERATVPDHRHRCYAEIRPAPRALAHQEAYCLSSAFPVCPTFQDWARRESARARDARAAADSATDGGAAVASASGAAQRDARDDADASTGTAPIAPLAAASGAGVGAVTGAGAAARAAADDSDERGGAGDDDRRSTEFEDEEPRRNPPRDWSAPPPWLASNEAASRPLANDPPDFLARRSEPGRGLAGSAADQLAGGPPPTRRQPPPTAHEPMDPDDEGAVDFEGRDLPRPALPTRRPRAYDQHLGGPSRGPDWERPRRYEAYPTIRTRMSMPAIPRIVVLTGALVVAALAIFLFMPALLGLGSGETAKASPSPSPAASESAAPPTPTPAPTPTIYTIKKGDTLSKIATANGITLDQLMAANPDIKNPNRISEGQEITIPAPEPSAAEDFGGSEAPSEGP